jgi:2-phospho-L-lactate guanylyltransferase
MTVVAVPVKDLGAAKQRLARVLTPGERSALARAMLADVLRALIAAGLDAIWLVTRDAEVARLARPFGVEIVAEDANRGHTAAVAAAQARAAGAGARIFITIPGDVPCVTPAEVAGLAGAAATAPAAVFVPSRSGLGTNGVALSPPALMPLTFGEPSFANHLATARGAGLAPAVLELAGLGLDVDGADDLEALLGAGPRTESASLIAGWRIGERLAPGRRAGAGDLRRAAAGAEGRA